jgi:oligopeptide transport system substrate-binding protein
VLRYGARMFTGIGVLATVSGCGPVSFAPDTPTPEPVETPADIPDPPPTPQPAVTPDPDTTPTPEPEPTPTPEPVEQALRIAGTFLDPAHASVAVLPECLRNGLTTAGLTRINSAYELEQGWADSWEPLEDGLGWRFRISANTDGWSNGAPVTAHDFAAHWRSVLDPETESAPSVAGLLGDISNALAYRRGEVSPVDVGINASNEWTLEVSLNHPRETFPFAVSALSLRPRNPADESDEDTCLENGPYTVTEVVNDESLTLRPADGQWDQNAQTLDRLEFTTATPGVALTAFQQGEIDLIRLTGTDVVRVPEDPLISDMVDEAQPDRVVMLVPNIEIPPFDRPEIRRALSLIIDRRRLEVIVEGRLMPASRLFPAGMFPDLDDAAAGITVDFDVDAAYEELESQDVPDPADWPAFGLDIPSGIGYLDRVARDIASQFRENLDIQVPIRVHDPDEYAEGLREGRFALFWFEWRYLYPDPASTYLELFASWRGGESPISWTSAEYDELLIAADELVAGEERANAWAGCEGLLQEHGACIPVGHPRVFYLLQPWVDGLARDGRGRLIIGDSFGIDPTTGVEILERSEN